MKTLKKLTLVILVLGYLAMKFQFFENFEDHLNNFKEYYNRKILGIEKVRFYQKTKTLDQPQSKEDTTVEVDRLLANYTSNNDFITSENLRALIVPHASWKYSSKILAQGFSFLKPTQKQTVFILGPTHKVDSKGCAASNFDTYQTPYGKTKIDSEMMFKLEHDLKFSKISEEQELEEASIELILPFIQRIFDKAGIELQIIPLYCFTGNEETRKYYGQKLQKYLDDPNNLFIISSDLTHWGKMYGNNQYDSENFESVNRQVEVYDQMVMREIAFQDPKFFSKFMMEYEYLQVCGAVCIDILLNSIYYSPDAMNYKTQFLDYTQSFEVQDVQKGFTFGMSSAIIYKPTKEQRKSNFILDSNSEN